MNGFAIEGKKPKWRGARLLALFATLYLPAGAGAVDFKGIELGNPLSMTEERAIFGPLDCNPMQLDPNEYQNYLLELQHVVPGARKVCTGSTSIAAVQSSVTIVLGPSRRVLRLTFQFPGEDYPQVVTAMTNKWGEGDEEIRDEHDESVWWFFDDEASVSVHLMPGAEASYPADAGTAIGLAEYSLPITTAAEDL